ncbi:hypothetical protein PV327_009120 [Microctonus hyperodae]|uniref:Chitin-binding type-2 domain-containing protein n=1 Tax=Microctonus hyperodae TaxID=165561 RepID=A0AA39FTQ9_MICHY|nr:hypothetical protein PV327_009120 [Microctonus hyperodae]
MRDRTWLLLALYGVLLVSAVSSALKGTRPKFKIATTSTTTTTDKSKQPDNETAEGDEEIEGTTSADVNATTSHTLTGIPQIDYIWDPNLPRELNGYNLSDYPFYSTIPNLDEIDFKCDGLHDGFYASVPHKCQVYHHCLYGTRYDFLCANFTAFDQKTFICHFASEVDCANSKKYWHRNDALYKAVSTTTIAPPSTTTTTTTTPSSTTTAEGPIEDGRLMPRRRRPFRRRPAYDYYDEEYYDDDYERPRTRGGYDRRDEYDYDDRQYSRRDNRERDRDHARNRDRNYREPVVRTRERIPNRSNWRDAPSGVNRQPDDVNDDDRGKINHHDDRRYEKGPAKYDYDQEPSAPSATGGLVKPAAASGSVYSRPRTPPKIRRPVPLSAQDKFAYKTSAIQPTVGDSHKRPIEPAATVPPVSPSLSSPIAEDDYYEDDVEDTRPRRPMRRRPYRERERHFYDQPRDMRDKERIRPMRTRYRDDDDDDEMRPKKYPERPRERDRYYERSRDRALDREKDLLPERIIDERERESRPSIRTKEPSDDFIETSTRKNNPSIHKNNEAIMRTIQQHNNDDEISEQHRHLLSRPHKLKFDKQAKSNRPIVIDDKEETAINNDGDKNNREQLEQHEKLRVDDEYTSEDEYYDEPEYSPPSSPRTAVRIVKRPFLPSRGGNSNPRGLSLVGNKAPKSNRNNNTSSDNSSRNSPIENDNDDEYYRVSEKILHRPNLSDEKRGYNAYKIISSDMQHKQQIDFNANSNQRRPIALQDDNINNNDDDLKPKIPWNGEEVRVNLSSTFNNENRGVANENNRDNYDSTYTTEPSQKETNKAAIGSAIKQRINEVTHQLEDIPESEYDVTLNEALTPSLHQESTLPSGFILPIQRHQNRDPVLQSSENNYRVSRPYSNPHQHQSQAQLQHHQQNGFIPSTQFVPLIRIGNSNNNNDERSGSVQYYKTPTVHVPGPGSHSRQSGRGPWHDYTGY